MITMERDNISKIVVIGNMGVGKWSLIRRFAVDEFIGDGEFVPVIAKDFKVRTVNIDGKPVRLHIWYQWYSSRYKFIFRSYYRNTKGILIVYDVTRKDSYQDIQNWIKDVDSNSDGSICKLLIGNKADLDNERVIPYSQAKSFADEMGLPFIETSAKTSINVEQAFKSMASMIKNKEDQMRSNGSLRKDDYNVRIQNTKPVKEYCYCS